nr:retrovirus-related Pol polyprotein from transposon TNT 1-94 [Tanacetum cinerariifolium]
MPPKLDLVFHNVPNDVKTDHPTFNVKLGPTKPDQALSHTHRPLAPIIEDWVSDSEDESKTKTPQNVPSVVQSTEQVQSPRPSVQHVETSILAATPKPKKAQPTARHHAQWGNDKQYAQMTLPNPQRYVVPTTVVPKSKLVTINVARPITAVVPKIKVTRATQYKPLVTKPNSPIKRHINCSPSPKATNSPPRVTAVKALVVNAAKGVIDSGCSRHMTWNMSYLSDVYTEATPLARKEEVYVFQPPRFQDPDYPDKVHKVVKALYGLHQAPRAWYESLANYLLENGLQVKQKKDGIFISQDKYVAEILRKFGLTDGKSASTPIDTEKPFTEGS